MSNRDAYLLKFDFKQGFDRESSEYAEEGKWYDGDRVRFRAGKPEVIRGYETKVSATFDGNARDLVTWRDNRRLKRAAFGTEKKLFEHKGRAVVFSSLNDLAKRIDDPNLDVKKDDILVLQNQILFKTQQPKIEITETWKQEFELD